MVCCIDVLQTQRHVLYQDSQEGLDSLELEVVENIKIAFMN